MMLTKDMTPLSDPEDPDSPTGTEITNGENSAHINGKNKNGFFQAMTGLFAKPKNDTSFREAIEEAMENGDHEDSPSISAHEKTLISNVLNMRDMCVADVMIPRADIGAIEVSSSREEIYEIVSSEQHSRYPIYRENLDEIIGTVHIKDILLPLMRGEDFNIEALCRSIPIVSPAMPALDLLLEMRETKKHMVLVVDEYGGIDGMVTIGDLIEDIIGNIDDEHDQEDDQQIIENKDGSLTLDARVYIDDFEANYGQFLNDEEREENNTLAGVVFSIAGRVPARGEVLTHESGAEFEILEADLRRINRLKIRNLPRN